MTNSISLQQINAPKSKSGYKTTNPRKPAKYPVAVARAKMELQRHDEVVLGFSGGKDSSATLVVVTDALLQIAECERPLLHVVYCDTGVDIPPAVALAKKTLRSLRREYVNLGVQIKIHLAKPAIEKRFFVRVIGRGYATPTNFFRWCTRDLRINPVRDVIAALNIDCPLIILGTRVDESPDRARNMSKHAQASVFHQKNASGRGEVFAPIADFDAGDVWDTLHSTGIPAAIDRTNLLKVYKDAGSECPPVRDEKAPPCGKGRFGCWTCTVVRKDKAVTSLIESGYDDLRPLLEFRNWISVFRDLPSARARYRRNGEDGPGPFTIDARKTILRKLRHVQRVSGYTIIDASEIEAIHKLWRTDRRDPTYRE